MAILLLLLYTLAFFFLIRKLKFFRLEGLRTWTPSFFFGLKLVGGVALYVIYTVYYTDRKTSDIWKYFDDSKVMYDALWTHPGDFFRMLTGIGDNTPEIQTMYYSKMNFWYRLFDNNLINDAHIVIRFNAFARIFSLGNYHIHSLFMCFCSFSGFCGIYKIIYPVLKQWRGAVAALLFLLPSLVFWTSGVMKEGLMFLGLGMLIYHSFTFTNDKKWWRIILILLSALLLLFSKFYVIVAIIPSLAAALWARKSQGKTLLKFSVVFFLFFAFAFSLRWIAPEREPLRLLANKQNDFLKMSRGGITLLNDSAEVFISDDRREDVIFISDSFAKIKPGAGYYYRPYRSGFLDTVFVKNNRDTSVYKVQTDLIRAGSLLHVEFLHPSFSSFLKEAPVALFTVLFRPFPWEAKNPMLLLPAIENLLMIVLVLLIFAFPGKISSPELFGLCMSFSFLLLLVIGLTTPVLGALVRYRIAAQPFLLIALLMLIDRNKLMKKFPKLEKLRI